MEQYVGLDVSLKQTAICIVDRTGKIEREGVAASDPETIAAFIKSHAPHVARIGLETGATATWLWTELNKLDDAVDGGEAWSRPWQHDRGRRWLAKVRIVDACLICLSRSLACGNEADFQGLRLDDHAADVAFDQVAILIIQGGVSTDRWSWQLSAVGPLPLGVGSIPSKKV